MDAEQLKNALEGSLNMSTEELKEALPPLLKSIREMGAASLLEQVPDAVPQLIRKLNEIDIKSFIDSSPDISAEFMDILWSSAAILAEKDPEAKVQLARAGEVRANFIATDTTMESNLVISDGKLAGGAGLLDKSDISLSGPVEVMLGLLTGSLHPISAFMAGKYKMEGNMGLGMKLAPIMTSVTKIFANG